LALSVRIHWMKVFFFLWTISTRVFILSIVHTKRSSFTSLLRHQLLWTCFSLSRSHNSGFNTPICFGTMVIRNEVVNYWLQVTFKGPWLFSWFQFFFQRNASNLLISCISKNETWPAQVLIHTWSKGRGMLERGSQTPGSHATASATFAGCWGGPAKGISPSQVPGRSEAPWFNIKWRQLVSEGWCLALRFFPLEFLLFSFVHVYLIHTNQ
jgi:hypothetical protein